MSVSLSGNDVLVLNGRVLSDVADGDYAVVNFDTDLANLKRSKDGNAIYAKNEMGNVAKVTARFLFGSNDDIFLNSLLQDQQADFAGFTLLTGSFTKRVGDGKGATHDVVYQLSGGVFTRWPNAKSNAEGDVEKSVAVYEFLFNISGRSVQ